MRLPAAAWLRLLAVGLGLAALTGCGVSRMETDLKIQAYLADAQRLAQIGQTAQACRSVDRAIDLDPQNAGTYVSDPTSAAEADRLSIRDVFASVGDDPDMVRYMQQAIRKFPDRPEPRQVLADALGRLGDVAGQRATAATLAAMLEKKMALPGTVPNATLLSALAQAYWDAGDAARGTLNYQSAMRVYPMDPNPCNNLAYAYAVHNINLPDALHLAQKAIQLARSRQFPEEVIGTYEDTLAWVQYRQGDAKSALVSLQDAVNAVPRQPEIRYHLAMVYLALGRTEAARAEFSHALMLSKGYAEAKRQLDRLPAASKNT